ncbi:MFS transporter [Paraburkholderia sediminicola]|uniref:MFS transporter n=1 Tax=Paraburkholderia sediminicola TaxID=458836 RepID=UPI0038B79995
MYDITERRAPVSAWYALFVLVLAAVMSYVDREVLVLMAEPMKRAFNLTDARLGLLQGGGVALFAGIAALPIGWLADRFDRRIILVVCVCVWSTATAFCGLASNFPQLFAASIGLGIGEGALVPVVYGLIPELFPPTQRVFANALFAIAVSLGAGLGLVLAGAAVDIANTASIAFPSLIEGLETWRVSFFVVALPAPLLVVLVMLIRTPKARPRGEADTHSDGANSVFGYISARGAALFGFFGTFGLSGLSLTALMNWIPVVAMRTFHADPNQVGKALGTVIVVGSIGGFLISNIIASWGRRRHAVRASLMTCILGFALAAALCGLFPFAANADQLYGVVALQLICVMSGSMLMPSIMQNISPPHMRSQLASLGALLTVIISAFSPVLVGMVSDHMSAVDRPLLTAIIYVSAGGFALGAVLLFQARAAVVAAIEALQAVEARNMPNASYTHVA